MKLIKSGLLILIIITLSACGEKVQVKVEKTAILPVAESKALDRLAEIDVSKHERHVHVESVRVYIDGYVCPDCITSPIKESLQQEEGVKIVAERPEVGMIEIVPKPDEYIDLLDIKKRINSRKEFTITRMEVVVSGRIVDYVPKYYSDTPYAHTHERYQLIAGKKPYPYNTFVLAEGKKLEELEESGYERIVTIGTVTSFYDNRIPILHIMEFKKLEKP